MHIYFEIVLTHCCHYNLPLKCMLSHSFLWIWIFLNTVNQLSTNINKGIIFEIPVTQVSACIFIFHNINILVISKQYEEFYFKLEYTKHSEWIPNEMLYLSAYLEYYFGLMRFVLPWTWFVECKILLKLAFIKINFFGRVKFKCQRLYRELKG